MSPYMHWKVVGLENLNRVPAYSQNHNNRRVRTKDWTRLSRDIHRKPPKSIRLSDLNDIQLLPDRDPINGPKI